jgi:hypothetical protein
VEYSEFIDYKSQLTNDCGFEPTFIPEQMFPFQKFLLDWSVRKGRDAILADCGLGKSFLELAWSQNVTDHVQKPILLLTPLAVSYQTEREAHKFGIDAEVSRNGKVPSRITITNYDNLHLFNADDFGGVVCDESSILKSFDGAMRSEITNFMRKVQYRLLGTASAAPNDFIELGTQSEALGYLGYIDMLSRFFVCDQRGRSYGNNEKWRFKGHAQSQFWKWVASWARAVRKPSDIGFSNEGFDLPELINRTTWVEAKTTRADVLFDMPATSLWEWREENKRTVKERCETAAALVEHSDHAVIWCQLNEEGRLLNNLIEGSVEVTGQEKTDVKEEKLAAFSRGDIKKLITKPKIGAWGLNWQHCAHMTYFPTYSYEMFYQSQRRCWRFGQARPVTVDTISTRGGENAVKAIERKALQADEMFSSLVEYMNEAISIDRSQKYEKKASLPNWVMS